LLEIIRPSSRKTLHHARKPSTELAHPAPWPSRTTITGSAPKMDPSSRQITRSAHNRFAKPNHAGRLLAPHGSVQRTLSNASEPSSRKRLDATHSSGADDNPVRTHGCATGQHRPKRTLPSRASRDAPEPDSP